VLIGVIAAIVVGLGIAGFFALRDDGSSSAPSDSVAPADPDPTPPEEPDVTIPDVTGPDVTRPEITIPDFTMPTFPDLTVPDFSLPTFPDFTVPELSIPDLSIPDMPGTLAPPGSIPESTEPPDGLGDDTALDALAEDCFDGSMEACDELYGAAESGTEYRRYGDTCAGRQPENTQVYCVASFPS
jgi:hypothetical protein